MTVEHKIKIKFYLDSHSYIARIDLDFDSTSLRITLLQCKLFGVHNSQLKSESELESSSCILLQLHLNAQWFAMSTRSPATIKKECAFL